MTEPAARRHRVLVAVAAFGIVLSGLGCATRPARLLDAGSSPTGLVVRSDDRLTLSALPYSGAMERAGLGVNLHHDQQLAIELKVERSTGAGGPTTLSLRRHDVQLVFADGERRYTLDPLKVYEENRVNVTGVGVMFGLIAALAAESVDDDRMATITDLAVGEIRLDDSQRSAGGFLFFDMTGLTQHRAAQLVVEYEDVTSGEVHTIELDVALDGDYERVDLSRKPQR